jgi:hypothetical protein
MQRFHLNLQPKGKTMRPVLRYQSQLLFRKSYKPARLLRIRPTAKGMTFRPPRANPEPQAIAKGRILPRPPHT